MAVVEQPKDNRPPSLAYAESVRQAQIAAGVERAKGGGQTDEQKVARELQRLARKLNMEPHELVDALEKDGPETWKMLRPLALQALARDLNGSNEQNRKAAWTRVLDQTDGKLAKDDDDAPRVVEFYSAALGDERPAEADPFTWED